MTLLALSCLGIALALAHPAELRAQRLAPPVRLEADGAPIDTGESIAHAGPLVADFDHDGTPDLLVGNFRGTIQLYKNVGTAAAPRYESKGLLQAAGEDVRIHNW